MATLNFNYEGYEAELQRIEGQLNEMPTEIIKSRALKASMRDASRPIHSAVRREIPKPGYPGDKTFSATVNARRAKKGKGPLTPLNRTVKTKIKELDNVWMSFIGPSWQQGPHGHVVNFGHRIRVHAKRTGRVTMRPFVFATNRLGNPVVGWGTHATNRTVRVPVFAAGREGLTSPTYGVNGATRPVMFKETGFAKSQAKAEQKMVDGARRAVENAWIKEIAKQRAVPK